MKKMFSKALCFLLVFSLTTSPSFAANAASEVSPYAIGTETFYHSFVIDVPAYYDKDLGYTYEAGTVVYHLVYRVSYDLNSGQIKSVSIVEESLDDMQQDCKLRHFNTLYATNLSSGYTISSDKYSITFNLRLSGSVTFYSPLIGNPPFEIRTITGLSTGSVTVKPPTT